MIRNNKFFVKKYDEDENKITLEEERKYHSPFVLFLINEWKTFTCYFSSFIGISIYYCYYFDIW